MFFSFGRWKWRISPSSLWPWPVGTFVYSHYFTSFQCIQCSSEETSRVKNLNTDHTSGHRLFRSCRGNGQTVRFSPPIFLKKVALTLAGNTPSEIRRMWNGKLKPRLQAPRACKSLQIVSAKVFAWCHIVKKLPTRGKGGTGSFAPLARYQALKEPQNTWSKQAI